MLLVESGFTSSVGHMNVPSSACHPPTHCKLHLPSAPWNQATGCMCVCVGGWGYNTGCQLTTSSVWNLRFVASEIRFSRVLSALTLSVESGTATSAANIALSYTTALPATTCMRPAVHVSVRALGLWPGLREGFGKIAPMALVYRRPLTIIKQWNAAIECAGNKIPFCKRKNRIL